MIDEALNYEIPLNGCVTKFSEPSGKEYLNMLGNKALDYQFIVSGGQINKVVQDKVFLMSLNVGKIETQSTEK